ncbi:arylsulfatase [Haloferula sp. A504]|uniref:arylsulfatase n=1 Tax=Haloferula sp. A504 TaxID=3373601 RepID=UPI0031C292F5|nr:arylsulfatase [Verrucomicrobiaceae bacterium E54]
MKVRSIHLTAVFLLGLACLGPPAAAAPRNVVFILADDLGWGELGCYGQQKIRTPHIDRLAAEGTRFTRHYSGAPVCAPARCVLLTGKHLGHAEIRGNRQAHLSFPRFKEGQHPISSATVTLAEVFRDAGFATGAMGKWGLGPVDSTGDPNSQGFDLFFGYNCQAVAHSFYPRFLWRNDRQVEINPHPIPGHGKQAEGEVKMEDWIGETYASIPIREAALKFIRDNKDRRFFLYLPFTEPHVAMHPPVGSVDEYPEEWDDRPYRGQCAYLPHPRPRAGYAAMISDLDRHVGDVVNELRGTGILDETLIIFTSDNGTTHRCRNGEEKQFGIGGVDADFFHSTGGLRGFKGSVYEGGLRVPMIARLPGTVPAGATNDVPSYFADWFPTLCSAFGLENTTAHDGDDLWPVIGGKASSKPRKPMVWVYPEYGGQVAVNFGEMKVVRQRLNSRNPGPWEVYDLAKDPAETTNIADENPEIVAKAVAVLKRETNANDLFPLTIPGVND